MLPAAYTHLSRRFLGRVYVAGAEPYITAKEWRRGTVSEPDGWTYPAKGIWVTFPDLPNNTTSETREEAAATGEPSLTVIGSLNYTKRSYSLDLEVGALVVTEDGTLRKKLRREVEGLEAYTRTVSREELRDDEERKVGWKTRVAMWVVGVVGGALSRGREGSEILPYDTVRDDTRCARESE